MDRISTILITGMTGCGKTAVIQKILKSLPVSARCAVCIHQHARAFGLETNCPVPDDFDMDDPRLALYFEVYDFGSGCICCSPDGDLTRALTKIGSEMEFQRRIITHLVVETTGIADPRPFSRLLSTNEDIIRHFRLDSVAVVLNTAPGGLPWKKSPKSENLSKVWRTQICNSEIAILHKLDLIDPSSLKDAIESECKEISSINSNLRFVEDKVAGTLDWSNFSFENRISGCGQSCGTCNDRNEWTEKLQLVTLSGHDQTFQTACVVESGGVILERFTAWLTALLDCEAASAGTGGVWHVKGFFAVRWEQEPDAEAAAALADVRTANAGLRMAVVSAYAGGPVRVWEVGAARRRHAALGEFDGAYEGAVLEAGTCKLFFLGSVGAGPCPEQLAVAA